MGSGLAFYLHLFCNVVYELSGFFPAEAGVGDGAAVDVAADFLASGLDIAFDHHTFYHIVNRRIFFSVVQDFFCDANLLCIFFAGIGMVSINDACRVLQIHLVIHFDQATNVFVMVIWTVCTEFVDGTTKNNM